MDREKEIKDLLVLGHKQSKIKIKKHYQDIYLASKLLYSLDMFTKRYN